MMRLSFLAALSATAAVSANNAAAPVDMFNKVSFMKNLLASPHFEQHRRRTQDDMGNTDICDSMSGKMISETECQMCPGGDEEGGCCTIDMESFDFGCDVCENIGGELECARVQCGLNDSGGYGCNGCGEYSSGEACFDFSCDGASDGEADCTCNGITWNDQDCGECVIDKNDNPVFDCSAVGGPSSDSSPSSFVGASAAIIVISAFGVIANLIY